MLSASFIAKKPLKFVTAAAAVLLSAGTENLASHSESIKAHTGQVHALKLNLNLQRGRGIWIWSKIKAAPSAKAVDAKEGTANFEQHHNGGGAAVPGAGPAAPRGVGGDAGRDAGQDWTWVEDPNLRIEGHNWTATRYGRGNH